MKQIFTIMLLAFCAPSGMARLHYVNVAAVGLNNGTSWANAWTDLSTAIVLYSSPGDTFWVVRGTYISDMAGSWGFHVVDRYLFGGFEGTETQLSQRNFVANRTIIAGTNGYYASMQIEGNSRVDGFTLTNNTPAVSQTSYMGIQFYGAGYMVMENCIVTNHYAKYPIYIVGNQVVNFLHCQFLGNHAPIGSTSSDNYGSAIRCDGNAVSVFIDQCLFANNSGQVGAAIQLYDSSAVTVNRSIFYGNEASIAGGAFYDDDGAKLKVFNSLIVGNKAPLGGAHYGVNLSRGGTRNFSHCTIANNWSSNATAPNYAVWLSGASDTLRNSIVWGDSTGTGAGPEVPLPKAGCLFNRNVIKGAAGFAASTNTYTFNPLFVLPGKVSSAPFPSTSNYDYHLAAFSEAIDTGVNLGLGAPYNLDLDNNPRVQGLLPDLGAYEWKTCQWLTIAITPSGPTTFCQPGSVTLTASANPLYTHTYQWNLGTALGSTITVTTTGVNKVVVVDSLGCRSAAGVSVQAVAPPNPVITQTSNTLNAPAGFTSYQWYLNGSLITGATSASYNPSANGNYTVKVTTIAGNCPGTSAVYNLHNLSAGSISIEQSVSIYPNPGDGRFSVSFTGSPVEANICISDLTGRRVFQKEYDHLTGLFRKEIDVSRLAKGMYLVRIETGRVFLTRKLIIQ